MKERCNIYRRDSTLVIWILIIMMIPVVKGFELDFKNNETTVITFYNARDEVSEMLEQDMQAMRIYDMITDAEIVAQSGDYDKLRNILRETRQLTLLVQGIYTDLERTDNMIAGLEEQSVNTSDYKEYYEDIIDEVEMSNYEDARIMLTSLYNDLKSEIRDISYDFTSTIELRKTELSDRNQDTAFIDTLVEQYNRHRSYNEYDSVIRMYNALTMINDTLIMIRDIIDKLEPIKEKGLPVDRFNESLSETITLLRENDFESAYQLVKNEEETLDRYYTVSRLNNKTMTIHARLEEIGEKDPMITELMNSSQEMIREQDYEEAEIYAREAYDLAEQKQADSLILSSIKDSGFRTKSYMYIKLHWKWLVIVLIASVFILKVLYIETMVLIYKARISQLQKEHYTIKGNIMKIQKERFIHKIITDEEYRSNLARFQERIVKIKEEIPILKQKIYRKD